MLLLHQTYYCKELQITVPHHGSIERLHKHLTRDRALDQQLLTDAGKRVTEPSEASHSTRKGSCQVQEAKEYGRFMG